MSRKKKKDDVDFLEGFDFESVLEGEINGPEAFIPLSPPIEAAIEPSIRNSVQDFRQTSNKMELTDRQPLDSDKTAIDHPLASKMYTKAAVDRQPLDSDKTASKNSLDSHYTADWTAGNSHKTADRQPLDSHRTANEWTFDRLGGKEAELVQIVFQACLNSGSRTTGKMATNGLRRSLEVSTRRLSNLIERLGEKKLLNVADSKRGNGAFRQFSIPEKVFKEMRLSELASHKPAIRQPLHSHYTADWTADKTAALSSSSRGLNFKESTTTQAVDNFSRLFEIDVTVVQAHGITHSVLSRCIELYPVLKPEQLEVLVSRFAEFMKAPKNKVQNARGFFISLAEQASKGQVPLDHIETQDEALMREFVKQRQESLAQRNNIEKQAQVFEFEAWLESLTGDEKLALVPESSILKLGALPHTAMLRQHFTENIWPARREQILGGGS